MARSRPLKVAMRKSTRSPAARPPGGAAAEWTKTSGEPSSGSMKPKSPSNQETVPA